MSRNSYGDWDTPGNVDGESVEGGEALQIDSSLGLVSCNES